MRPVLFALALAGCSTSAADFQQGDVPQETFARDSAACEFESERGRTMHGLGGMAGIASYYESYGKMYDACMRSKGYQRR